jgi:hypothetical protein
MDVLMGITQGIEEPGLCFRRGVSAVNNSGYKLKIRHTSALGNLRNLVLFPSMGILGKTLCSDPRRRPEQASPWEHRPSSSAPCAVPMRLSRIDQHINDEPCAKQRALLGVFSSRPSSVSRGVRSAAPIFFFSPKRSSAY